MKLHSAYLISASCAILSFPTESYAGYANWFGFRGAQVQSIIALEGGYLFRGNFSTSEGKFTNTSSVNPKPNGVYQQLDLKIGFVGGTDAEQILVKVAEPLDSNAPNWVNGAMFHNDRSWWTFA